MLIFYFATCTVLSFIAGYAFKGTKDLIHFNTRLCEYYDQRVTDSYKWRDDLTVVKNMIRKLDTTSNVPSFYCNSSERTTSPTGETIKINNRNQSEKPTSLKLPKRKPGRPRKNK